VDRKEIGKITNFCDCEYCKERGYLKPVIDNPNIFITLIDMDNKFHGYKFYDDLLDLIKPGDYVNGEKVLATKCKVLYYDEDDGNEVDICNALQLDHSWIYFDYEIDTVVTKEQFDAISYEVK
jgi:hypothetical protein